MAITTALATGLWFYLVLSHLQLFSASFIKTDVLKLRPQPVDENPDEDISWDFMVLAVQWPQSYCYELLDLRYANACMVPSEVTQWTIHGLWPSTYSGKDVFNCNTSYPFNVTQIQDLLGDLQIHWPSMLDVQGIKLWAHEWNKHGTCAGILPELAGEHNYFSKTMKLLQTFKFDSIFQDSHLEPSGTKLYKADNFTEAINKTLGVSPVINCYTTVHRKEQTTFIEQVEICLDKSFQPIKCPAVPDLQGNCGKRDLHYPTIVSS